MWTCIGLIHADSSDSGLVECRVEPSGAAGGLTKWNRMPV